MKLIKTEEIRFFAEHLINRKEVSLIGKKDDKVVVLGIFTFPKPQKNKWDDRNVTHVMELIQSHETLQLLCEEFNYNLKAHYRKTAREENDVFADHEQIAILHGIKRKPEYPLAPRIPRETEDATSVSYQTRQLGTISQVTMVFGKSFKFRFNLLTGPIDKESLDVIVEGYALLLRRGYLIQEYTKQRKGRD